ncbi:MAG: CRISPR-associated ring nuclease [Gammaproteobacteria bacterium]
MFQQRRAPTHGAADSLCPRRVLICLPGERPHLVTQAIYGLATAPNSWLPDEVIVITNQRGAHELQARLIRQPRFRELCRRVGVHGADNLALNVEVVGAHDTADPRLQHVSKSQRRQQTSSFFLARVQAITDQTDTELCVCLAQDSSVFSGFVVGQVMSMLGRPQDRLIEVSVNGAQLQPDFFFPVDTSSPQIEVTDLSYMRIERVTSMRALTRNADYATLCRGLSGPAHLRVRNEFRGLSFRFSDAFDIRCDSSHRVSEPRFEPRAAALYAYYAQSAYLKQPFVSDEKILDDPDDYLELYEACLLGGEIKSERTLNASGLTRAGLRSARSRIGRTLAGLLRSGSSYSDYRIYRRPQRKHYGLRLSPDQIAIDGSDGAISAYG